MGSGVFDEAGVADAVEPIRLAGRTRLKAHPNGSYLTVICSVPELERFGRLWPNFRRA